MSASPILEYWPEGIAAARIPANNNVRLLQALKINPAISASTAAQPASPAEGDVYILPASPTGANWGSFNEGDVVIYYDATWTAYEPVKGLRKFVEDEGEDWQFVGDSSGGWAAAGGGGGGGSVAGADKQIQYNNSGAFGAEAGFEYDQSTNTFSCVNATVTGLENLSKGSNIASASTTNIATATGNFVHITGTTTITALGTAQAGAQRIVVFDGALTLTHNATSLILPTGSNITTAAGDTGLLISEGSGNWKCVAYQKVDGTALAGGGGSLTGFTAALNTASPNNGTNASSLIPSGGTTNQAGVYGTKGTGALIAQIPDSTAAGGNVRGSRAVDWQFQRVSAAQVASGTNAAIVGGQSNTGSGNYSVSGGDTNTASGDSSVALGKSNTATQNRATALGDSCNATANYAFAQGFGAAASGVNGVSMGESTTSSGTHSQAFGSNTLANANYSQATGLYSSAKLVIGAWARASYRFSTTGDCQHRDFHLASDTTTATPEAVTSNNSTPGTTNQITLDNNSSYIIKGTVVARQNTTGDAKAWEFTAHIKRGANAAATALLGAVTPAVIGTPDAGAAAWVIAVTADTTNGCLKVEVTGEASKTIKWSTHVYSCNEVVG
jgi:hypothetical protein